MKKLIIETITFITEVEEISFVDAMIEREVQVMATKISELEPGDSPARLMAAVMLAYQKHGASLGIDPVPHGVSTPWVNGTGMFQLNTSGDVISLTSFGIKVVNALGAKHEPQKSEKAA